MMSDLTNTNAMQPTGDDLAERVPSETQGVLYGVSVGPGDPELMTQKAIRVLRECAVWAVPRTSGADTVALDIAGQVVCPSGKKIVYLDFVMTRDREKLEIQHRNMAQMLRQELDAGSDVAVLNLGDVSVYSTFSYLADVLVREKYRVSWIPGVTSFCAAACALGISLTEAKKPLHIFPGSYSLDAALEADGGKVLMKTGKQLSTALRAVEAAGLAEKACLVSNCGMKNEKRCPRIQDAHGDESYFTTVIIRP